MSGQSRGKRPRLVELKDQLTCKLCGGYFIDATTVIECLHTFCKSCIVKYLETSKNCPVCLTLIHKNKPLLNIKPDQILQDVVYKLVPGCYHNEMQCRKEFYAKHPEAKSTVNSPEARGEPVESYIFSPDESLSLSLEYYSPDVKEEHENDKDVTSKHLPKRYFRCPAAVTVFHLQKLLRAKHGLSEAHPVDIMYKEEPLCENYTLMDVMYIYHWKRKVPLHLSYRIFESATKRIKLSDDNDEFKQSLDDSNIELESKDEKSTNSEWKEVQLKISETGVMSVMDISNLETNKSTKSDDTNRQNEDKSIKTVNKTVAKLEEKEETKLNTGKGRKSNQDKKNEKSQSEKHSKAQNNAKSEEKLTKNEISNEQSPTQKSSEKCEIKSLTGKNEISKLNIKSEKSQTLTSEQKSLENDASDQLDKQTDNKQNHGNSKVANNTNVKAEMNSKSNVKSNETKGSLSAGAKINALSAKLQFQPKNNQINNSCMKKSSTEKQKAGTSSLSTTIDVKSSKASSKQELKNLDASSENNTTDNHASSSTPNKDTVTHSNLQIPIVATSNSDNNWKQKCDDKNKALTADQQLRALPGMPHIGKDIICSTTAASSPGTISGRFSIQAPSMSIYSITPSSKSNAHLNSNHTYSASISKQTAALTSSKSGLEVTTIYSLPPAPPCPDAIPISLLKGGRKDASSKGSNLNEICAKIGSASSSSGSKINDICAKIGESSKEKCRLEAQRKSEVPELLKIPDNCMETSASVTKHIPNIPNVPIYTPSNSHHGMLINEVKDKKPTPSSMSSAQINMLASQNQKTPAQKKHSQAVGYKTLRDPPKSWNPTLSKNNYVAAKNQAKELQNQMQYGLTDADGAQKQIPSKPAKIFKIRNMPRYLGNPASGVKPMYGISNDQSSSKEKDTTNQQQQSQSQQKSSNGSKGSLSMNMMKIDPQTLSPIVSSPNSPIVSPPPYSPSAARNYPTSSPFCGRSGATSGTRASSPRNSPVNMLSTNPFISSHPLSTNPRLIYSHFSPTFNEHQHRLSSNPLIRSPIGMPPPSAFHSSLPPAINKLYQRTAGFIGHQAQQSAVAAAAFTQARLAAAAAAAAAAIHTSSSGSSTGTPSSKPPSVSAQSMVDTVAMQLAKGLHRDLTAFDLSRVDAIPSKQPSRPKSGPKLDETKSTESETININNEHDKTDGIKLNGGVGVVGDESKDGNVTPPVGEGKDSISEDSAKTCSPPKESGTDKGLSVENKQQNVPQSKHDQKAVESEKSAVAKKIGNEPHKTTIES